MADKEHLDEPSGDDINSLFAKCSLTLSKEILKQKDDELLNAITADLKFKITSFADLTIEKENVTEGDMSRLTEILKSKLEPRFGDDYVIIKSEKDEVNHQVPESDGAEKSHQAVKKEGLESLESFEQISGPSDVTEEFQSPEKIGNALKDSVAPQPANSQNEIDNLSNTFMRSLSLSESQTGDSSSRSTSQIMTGMAHQNLPANLEPTSSEEKRKYGSAPYQNMSSNQPVVSQPTGTASITSQKSDRPKRMTPHPPVDGKRDKQSRSGNQQKAENVSSTDTRGVRGIKDKDHEGNIGEMSSQKKEMPEDEIPQPSRHRDSNGGSGAENEGKVEDGQKNKNSTAVLNEETAKDGKMQANATSSKKTKKSERKPLEEVHEKAKDESDVSDVDSLGSDTGDKGKCATPYNGNKVTQSVGGKRGNPDQVSAGQELEEEGIGQVQGQSSITNQPDRMEHSRESELFQSQDTTDDVEMTTDDTLGTRTKTRQRLTEVALNQGNGLQGMPEDRNAAEEYTFDSHHTNQQMRKKEDLTKGKRSTRQSESDNDENYEGKGGLRYDTQDIPRQSSERPGEPRREAEKEKEYKESKQRGQEQAIHHSDDEHRMDTGEEQPFEPTTLGNQGDVNKSMSSEESYEEQGRNSEDLKQIRGSEGQSVSVSDEDDEPKKDNILYSQSPSERQSRIKEGGEPDRRDAKGKYQTGSSGEQSEDSTDEGDINTESTQSRQDSVATKHQKQPEEQRMNTGNVDPAERKRIFDNNTDKSDTSNRDETERKWNAQREMNVSNEQSCDGSEKQSSLTGNMHSSGKTKVKRRDSSDENDKYNIRMSPSEDCVSQSGKNEFRGHRREKEKEDSHPVRSEQQPGDEDSDEDKRRQRVGDLEKQYADKEDKHNNRISQTFLGHHGCNNEHGDVYSDDEDDNETSQSDYKSSARNDNSESALTKNRQDNPNSSGTSEDEATQRGLNESKNLYAKARSQMEEVSQEYSSVEPTRSHSGFAGALPKGQATAKPKKKRNYPEADGQQTDSKVLKGRNSYDAKEDMSTAERKGRGREKGDTENQNKSMASKEQKKEKEIKRQSGANAKEDLSCPDQSQAQSDDEESCIEYIMKKSHYKLAEKYFEGFSEMQYLCKAVEKDEGYLFSCSIKDTEDVRFIKALRKLKFDVVGHAENDTPKVMSIADQLKCKDLNVKVIKHGSRSFLVGPKEKVAEVKKKIISKLQETDENGKNVDIHKKPQRQRSQPDMRDDTNSSSRSSDGGTRPKNNDGLSRSKDKDLDDSKFRGDYTRSPSFEGDSMERHSRDAEPGVYSGRCSDIKVLIHNTDITRLDVDCIVNAANTKLKHGGGVARVIATAAGRELQDACARFIAAGNTVPVTGVFVSPGGYLPAKHVLHAVGPRWDLYDESDKKRCTDDLRHTVLRCLVEAMRRGLSSIALPSISAAIFKVPKEHCARSYMNAVKHFEEIVRDDMDPSNCSLKEIHFVDVDDTMVNYIRECFMTHWRERSDPYAKQADEKVFQEQLNSTKSQPPGKQISGSSQKPHMPPSPGGKPTGPSNVPLSNVTGATAKSVEKDTVYQVGGLQLCISSRPALSIRSDLVITVGEEFDKLSGIPDFNVKANRKPCENAHQKKNCYKFSYVHKPNGKYGQLLCRLLPDPKSSAELSSAFEHVDVAVRLAAVRGDKVKDVKSFVLTSSILYAEPSSIKKKAFSAIDRKLVGNFGKLVFDHVEKMSKESSGLVKQIVVTASEEASVSLCKILETRPIIKKIDTSAPGAYPYRRPRGESPSRRGAGSGGSSRPTSSSRQSNYTWQSNSGDRDSGPSSSPGTSSYGGTGGDSSVDQKQECEICASSSRSVKPVSCCQKLICATCENRMPQCPYCLKSWRIRTGDQPDGKMTVEHTVESADGYERKGSWKIRYYFPDGYQKPEHPNPGKMYKGTMRTAYIPAIEGSMDLLKMLRLAFIRRLIFTVGRSRTMGEDNRVTWNDIHHKTSLHSGNYGYPDHTYFHRVMQELTDRGVTLESMTEAENHKIKSFERSLTFVKRFSDYDAPVPMSASHYYSGTLI